MFALINTLREPTIETPDTGTFADGAFSATTLELHGQRRKDRRFTDHTRDYGADRKVQTGAIGYV
ncbi:hypothetical protein [Peteryoungia ipomoeae]|uniref:Uncharacterized protein n=1 Tax=Peteryoungia ipomoeae TaxID=1210932 RepID=A0A4S8PBF4_9HYPH|nr:hypothetical protein [Peteryoungia ipomoeae]THV25504.1 hypothetical protein FAA97_04755 [Peteryoungia ipomoeae]